MEGLECKLQTVITEFKSIMRDTEPRDLRRGALTRLKVIGQRLVRDIESELLIIEKLKDLDDESSVEESFEDESLGGEDYQREVEVTLSDTSLPVDSSTQARKKPGSRPRSG
jgi:hypothetical protein